MSDPRPSQPYWLVECIFFNTYASTFYAGLPHITLSVVLNHTNVKALQDFLLLTQTMFHVLGSYYYHHVLLLSLQNASPIKDREPGAASGKLTTCEDYEWLRGAKSPAQEDTATVWQSGIQTWACVQ